MDYRYDGLGRRIEKNVNGTITRYVYDNEDIIAEYDGSNVLQAKYLHGPGIDEPIRMERGGQSYFYHADGLGSITAITNSTGTTVRTYRYDAFGNIVSQTGSLSNPFTYTGRELDSETGLYYYRNRYYNPLAGRFLQEDKQAGRLINPQTLNLYVYALNNPAVYIDPYGNEVCLLEEPGLEEDYFGIDLLALGIIAAIEPSPAGEVLLLGRISGYTRHGLNQAISRGGRGVSLKAMLDAIRNPIQIVQQAGGVKKYIGKQATVVVNKMGEIITTWGKPRW